MIQWVGVGAMRSEVNDHLEFGGKFLASRWHDLVACGRKVERTGCFSRHSQRQNREGTGVAFLS